MFRSASRLAAAAVFSTLLSGCVIHGALPLDFAPLATPGPPAERIPISVKTSWPEILAATEAAVPRCAEGPPDEACPESAGSASFILRQEDDWRPIDQRVLGQQLAIKGAVWRRDPIQASIAGSHFSAALKLQYQVRIGGAGGRQLASCGYGEAPREVNVHLDGDLHFAREWYVDPTFTVDIEPLSRCRATFLNIDITDSVVRPIREALDAEAADATRRIRDITSVRDYLATLWAGLNQPILIDKNLWFAFNLSGASVSPPQITRDGQFVTTKVALEGTPKVIFGSRPAGASPPLPPLLLGDTSPKFDVRVAGLVTYTEASAILRQHLRGPGRPSNLLGSRIIGATVSGRGRNVVAAIVVAGALQGTFYFFGVPHFEPRTDGLAGGALRLDAVGFTVKTASPLTWLAVSIFKARIEHAFEAAARWDVSPEIQTATAQFGNELNRDLSPQAKLAGRLNQFGPGAVRVGPEGIEAWYQLGGEVGVTVSVSGLVH
jgi:hypothetical protein